MNTVKLHIAVLLSACCTFGQSTSGSLLGTVHDSSGAAVPEVAISATETQTNRRVETKSGPDGQYVLTPLPPGSYRLEATATGFKRFVREGIVLQVQQQPRVDIQLAVGELSEAVTVMADASTLETTTATIGKVVSNKAIVELPMNSRNVYSLIFLTPGVAGSIGNNYNSMSYSVNGARASMMDTLIDGATASHPTVQDLGHLGVSQSSTRSASSRCWARTTPPSTAEAQEACSTWFSNQERTVPRQRLRIPPKLRSSTRTTFFTNLEASRSPVSNAASSEVYQAVRS